MSIPQRLADSVLTNPGSDRVRSVAGLARRSARSRTGRFLAEGPQCAREALRAHLGEFASPRPETGVVEALYLTAAALERHPDIAELTERLLEPAASPRAFVRLVSDEVLHAMTDAEHPQGIVAVCRIPQPSWEQILRSGPRLVAVLCRVQDPGNAGTVLRAADAAGADAVVLTAGSVDLHNPKTVRSTAGSLFHLPVLAGADLADLEPGRMQVLAADGYGALDLDVLQDASAAGLPAAVDLARPTAWLFGNEAQGLSEAEKARAAHGVAVPLHGAAESLNVGTAATLCLYASARAQRRSTSAAAGAAAASTAARPAEAPRS
ncbi:RNA methyltransferase [Kocuria palustris]|uniref:TrmH family RNA methyltransferase n=1 Tax=Kocuria palustris TaxID=71999 RepID=UPI0011A0A7F5|nr:RNA methyltransferase [Kocuria palustris]